MTRPLCVLLPELGVLSETFLEWDVNHLLPGRTVVVADPPPAGETVLGKPSWTTAAPALRFEPLPGDPPPSPARRAALARFLRRHRVEIVLVQYLDFAERWFDTLRGLDVRVWLRGHGADLSARLSHAYRSYHAADGIIVPTRTAAARLAGIGLPRERIHVVPNHVEVPPHPPTRAAGHGTTIRCLSVGRLVPKKGHRHLIDALGKAAHVQPGLRLDIIGDGPLRAALLHQIDQADLANRVRLLGSRPPDQVLQHMRSSDIFVHEAITGPDGDAETQPLVILEAMATALPSILTRHEGIPEIIQDGDNALLVDERDGDATAKGLLDLAGDPALRHRIGLAGWHTVRSGHTHEQARRTLLGLLGLPQCGGAP